MASLDKHPREFALFTQAAKDGSVDKEASL
jgi:hypothetical protein